MNDRAPRRPRSPRRVFEVPAALQHDASMHTNRRIRAQKKQVRGLARDGWTGSFDDLVDEGVVNSLTAAKRAVWEQVNEGTLCMAWVKGILGDFTLSLPASNG